MDKKYTELQLTQLLKKAQDTYGYSNQISVSSEEFCELAAVLNKYIRYPSHELAIEDLREKVLKEYVDALICLKHILMIFQFSKKEIENARDVKLDRLERWLSKSTSLYESVLDRDVSE